MGSSHTLSEPRRTNTLYARSAAPGFLNNRLAQELIVFGMTSYPYSNQARAAKGHGRNTQNASRASPGCIGWAFKTRVALGAVHRARLRRSTRSLL